MKALERGFEAILWNSRFLTLLACVASLIGAIAMFYVATVDAIVLAAHFLHYGDAAQSAAEHATLRTEIVTGVASFVDGFLFALVLLIFAVGIYELFVSKIDQAENSEFAENILFVRSLDDLKDRLAKVILLILIVRYFEFALHREPATPLDLLYLAIGIALVGLALWFTRSHGATEPESPRG